MPNPLNHSQLELTEEGRLAIKGQMVSIRECIYCEAPTKVKDLRNDAVCNNCLRNRPSTMKNGLKTVRSGPFFNIADPNDKNKALKAGAVRPQEKLNRFGEIVSK